MSEQPTPPDVVSDAWTAYRVTHGEQTEALVRFIRDTTAETEARFRDAAAAFRTSVYARDVALLSHIEHIVSRAQIAAFDVDAALQRVSSRLDALEQHMDQETDLAQRRFDAIIARLDGLGQQLALREPGP